MIKELIKDEEFVYAIDSPEIKDFKKANKLVHSHIFPYGRVPQTLIETLTVLTIQVHIRKGTSMTRTFIIPTVEFRIYSHQDHMKVENIPKISDTRNDYISRIIDKKFNGRSSFGNNNDSQYDIGTYGSLDLVLNEEGSTSQGFLYRRMLFETKDFNLSRCEV